MGGKRKGTADKLRLRLSMVPGPCHHLDILCLWQYTVVMEKPLSGRDVLRTQRLTLVEKVIGYECDPRLASG